jgi:hypothetical protein
MNGRFIRAAAGAVTAGRFINPHARHPLGADRPVAARGDSGARFPAGNLAPGQRRRVLHAALGEQAARADGRGEGLEVLLVLVGVRRGEVRNRVVERG